MTERPILFSGPMVRAILDGTKTQTRMVVKPQPTLDHGLVFEGIALGKFGAVSDSEIACPYGTIGDRLWVKETFYRGHGPTWGDHCIVFHADKSFRWHPGSGLDDYDLKQFDKKPSIFMPRHASRITLEITNIRVERVRDITRDDAMEEGVERVDPYSITPDLPPGMPACWKDYAGKGWMASPIESFRTLWDSINAKSHPWAANPWVWVIEFGRAK